MTNFTQFRAAALALITTSFMAGPALADIIHGDDVIINNSLGGGNNQGSLCVGSDCVSGEVFNNNTFRLKEENLRIDFDDTSVGTFPANDWRFIFNDTADGGADYFAIGDLTAGNLVFRIDAGAPANALYVNSSGNVGLGTAIPLVELHILSGATPNIRLQQDGSGGNGSQTWDVASDEFGFFIRDTSNSFALPFFITSGAPTNAINIAASGNVGLGTSTPDGQLDIEADAPEFRLTETGAGAGDPLRFRLQSGTFRISFVDGIATEFLMDTDGNVTLQGSITTGGPTCGGGCDKVFEADYDLPSIEEHADQMWANKHLPAVGPTEPSKPVNLTDQYGNMLNELERAHIYIAQLNERDRASRKEKKALQAKVTRQEAYMTQLDSRLARLEELLSR